MSFSWAVELRKRYLGEIIVNEYTKAMKAEAKFSKIKDVIIASLKGATNSIKVAVAWLTDEDIIRTLTQRAEHGVKVQVAISDCKENFTKTTKFKDFLRFRGELFVCPNPFLHHKFCIVDERIIINGSYNWSYPARSNEENIVVFTLDNELAEDARFLRQFIEKHSFLCLKRCVAVTDMETLNRFKTAGKDIAAIISALDEGEVMLRAEFEEAVRASFEASRAARIPVGNSLLERMKSDGGGVEFVKRILHDEMSSGEMKSGFRELEKVIPHRVNLSLEYLVSRVKYQVLFTAEEVAFCNTLMRKYNLLEEQVA